jgi:hypothetical protein
VIAVNACLRAGHQQNVFHSFRSYVIRFAVMRFAYDFLSV